MDGWMDGLMDGWMDCKQEGQTSVTACYQHLVTQLGATCRQQAGKGSRLKGGSHFVVSQKFLRLEMPKTGAIPPLFINELITKYKLSMYCLLYAKQPIYTQYMPYDKSRLRGRFYLTKRLFMNRFSSSFNPRCFISCYEYVFFPPFLYKNAYI